MYKRHFMVAVFFAQALVTPTMGWSSDWRTILKQTKKKAPPKEFSSALRALAKLDFSPRPEHKQGWFAWTPGCNNVCRSFMLCWGLERSYRAQLRSRSKRGGYNFSLWAWVYDSEAHRKLAQEAYDWQAAVGRFKVVLESKGTLLVVFEGRGPAPDAGQLAAALKHPLPEHGRPGWGLSAPPSPPGQPAGPRLTKEMLRKRLLDPQAPDLTSPLATLLEDNPSTPEYQDRLRVAFLDGLAGIFGAFASAVPSMSQHDPCDEDQPPWMGEAFRDVWCAWSKLEAQTQSASSDPSPPELTTAGRQRYEAFCTRYPEVNMSSLIN